MKPRKLNHTVTHEVSSLVRMADIAEAILGERFVAGANVQYEIQVRGPQGGGKLDPQAEFLIVQFTREEQAPIDRNGANDA
jgi:hypothetical protein